MKAVIGAGFGDEGKGHVTHYLCSRPMYNPLVIRYCGGHQAGHTVNHAGIRHVFSNIGSGTLTGAPTYWSPFCTVEPIGLLRELSILKEKTGNVPTLFIDGRCPITTPWDIRSNEDWERKNKHGSCGVGYGETLRREEAFYSLTFLDLFYPSVWKEKYRLIQEYYQHPKDLTHRNALFTEACDQIINTSNILLMHNLPGYFDPYIFEGAQGLLLDQHFGFFPHVTRSNTGLANIKAMVGTLDQVDVFLVTRAYQTRHGNGFMSNEHLPLTIDPPEETNQPHLWQGDFRKTVLDFSLLAYAIRKETLLHEVRSINLVVTCLDHLSNFSFTENGLLFHTTRKVFLDRLVRQMERWHALKHLYVSESMDSNSIQKVF